MPQEETWWFNKTYSLEIPVNSKNNYEWALLFYTKLTNNFNASGNIDEDINADIVLWVIIEILNLSPVESTKLILDMDKKTLALASIINCLNLHKFVTLEVHGNIMEKIIVLRRFMDGGKLLDELDLKFPNGDDLEIIINGIQCL